MKQTWIVNDCLTCIPGTKTFWHMLLEIPGTIDKSGVSYPNLAGKIEKDEGQCDLIIRNATYFRRILKDVPQIALVQDAFPDDQGQIEVCRNATYVVFNSEYTAQLYAKYEFKNTILIPLGVNDDLFRPSCIDRRRDLFGNNNPVGIFVGDYNETKGTAIFEQITRKMLNINFIYVSKQGAQIKGANVKNYPGGVDEQGMAGLYNSSDFIIMCSPVETLHLASIEAALCDKAVIGTKTGWLAGPHFSSYIGETVGDYRDVDDYISKISKVLYGSFSNYESRQHIMKSPYTWSACKASWEKLIDTVLSQKK